MQEFKTGGYCPSCLRSKDKCKCIQRQMKSTPSASNDGKPFVIGTLTPHICPVCGGNGLVPNGFYMQTSGHWSSSDATPEKCRTCNNSGVVWG